MRSITKGIIQQQGIPTGPPTPSNWEYIETLSSAPASYDIYITSTAGDDYEAWMDLQNYFPVDEQNIGDIGVVYDGALAYYIFEAQ